MARSDCAVFSFSDAEVKLAIAVLMLVWAADTSTFHFAIVLSETPVLVRAVFSDSHTVLRNDFMDARLAPADILAAVRSPDVPGSSVCHFTKVSSASKRWVSASIWSCVLLTVKASFGLAERGLLNTSSTLLRTASSALVYAS